MNVPETVVAEADPVTVEVIRRRLIAIADQVDVNITRTAFSPLVYEYKDYAVGIVDAKGRLLCQCTGGLPLFVADVLGAAIRDGLAIYGEEGLHDGDIVITNHGGTIGQHLNNVVMYTPVFSRSGKLCAFMLVVMHWIDIGGMAIGSVSKNATDIFQEGIQYRTVKLHARGERVEDMYRMICHNSRLPEEVMGDIASQVAGCLMGKNGVAEIIARYGEAVYHHAIDRIWAQSEAEARAVIRQIPDGSYEASAFLEDDGVTLGNRIDLKVKVVIAGDEFTIDLSGVAPETHTAINSARSGGGETVARVAFRYLVVPEGHATEGSYRPLKLILPPGTVVSASDNAAKGNYNAPLPTLVDLVIRALGEAIPGRVAAGHFASFSTFSFVGRRQDGGAFFQCTDGGFGGWGALCDTDGPTPFRTMCHGDTRMIPIEVQEASYPITIDRFALRTDSGGAGQFRGGLGLSRDYTVLADCSLNSGYDRIECPAWGLNGGKSGDPGRVYVELPDKSLLAAFKASTPLKAGQRIFMTSGGGGGYGPPEKRDAAAIRNDLRAGYVSQEAAASVYAFKADTEIFLQINGD